MADMSLHTPSGRDLEDQFSVRFPKDKDGKAREMGYRVPKK
jgi:hypothetical protein